MNENDTATIIALPNDGPNHRSDESGNDRTGGIRAKLIDSQTPAFQAEFDPDEAEAAGAFVEDALSEGDALDSTHDCPQDAADSMPRA